MKTKSEFVNTWKYHVTGLALCGSCSDVTDGPLTKARKAWDIPVDVQKLLERMYDSLQTDAPLPLRNGQPKEAAR